YRQRGRGGGTVATLWDRSAGRRRAPAERLRRARGAGTAGDTGGRPAAVQQAARASGLAERRARGGRRASRTLPRLTSPPSPWPPTSTWKRSPRRWRRDAW